MKPGPGPIKKVAQTIKSNAQSRKEEKQRAADKGYKYNRNEVHDAGEGKVRNLKGSVGAVIKQEANQAKQNVKAKVGAAKKAVEAKVDKMQESRETRKAMNVGKKKLNEEKVKGDNKLGPIHMYGGKLRTTGDKKGPESKAVAKKNTVKGKNVIQKAKNKMAYSKGVSRSRKSGIS
jgi:hypothetical protein